MNEKEFSKFLGVKYSSLVNLGFLAHLVVNALISHKLGEIYGEHHRLSLHGVLN